ncbi:MAG: protein kinase [Polyangiaceae bacterium]
MLTKEALAREAATRIGRTVGDKWHVDALLGVGATAAVYAATHKNRSRVAIKWMHASLAASPARVATFLREGYIANGVSHPAVVRVFDDGSEDGAPFLVAELLEGETLADRRAGAAGGVLPLGEVVAACDTLLDALAVAHASGVLHRDIKASNLFRRSRAAPCACWISGSPRWRSPTRQTTISRCRVMVSSARPE